MHGGRHIFAARMLWLIVMAVFAMSCHKELVYPQDETPVAKPLSEVTVEFRISDPDAAPITRFNADDGYASDAEKKIGTLHLIVMDYDTQTGEETMEEVVTVVPTAADFVADGVRTGHTFRLASGTKRFYVGANMTQAHLNAFINKKSMKADSYEEALKMVMSNYQSNDGNGTDILMLSAPATEASGTETEIDITGKRLLYINARLERLVSKVMTVADYDGAKTDADGRAGETINYIEVENGFFFDFQFILYNANRTLSVAKSYEEDGDLFNADANWKMSEMIEGSAGSYHYKNMWDVAGNLSFWDEDGIKERLSTSDWWCMDVLPSDKSTPAPATKNAFMGKGLYCLENTVYDDLGLGGEDKLKASYLTTTHLYIKARFAPKKLNGDADGSNHTTNNRISHLYWQKDASGQNPYTFYINKVNGEFFTYTGAKRWISGTKADGSVYYRPDGTTRWQWSDFETYLGGWVYFKTFFEGDKDGGKLVHNDTKWGIRRNDYCMLTIENVENWGNSSPGEAFIKVKSETVPWVKRGSSDITVTPE